MAFKLTYKDENKGINFQDAYRMISYININHKTSISFTISIYKDKTIRDTNMKNGIYTSSPYHILRESDTALFDQIVSENSQELLYIWIKQNIEEYVLAQDIL